MSKMTNYAVLVRAEQVETLEDIADRIGPQYGWKNWKVEDDSIIYTDSDGVYRLNTNGYVEKQVGGEWVHDDTITNFNWGEELDLPNYVWGEDVDGNVLMIHD